MNQIFQILHILLKNKFEILQVHSAKQFETAQGFIIFLIH